MEINICIYIINLYPPPRLRPRTPKGFQENKPYDQMAYELISATGSNTPDTKDYNGAVNFILANMNDHAVLATARTSRVFLGKQLQCER